MERKWKYYIVLNNDTNDLVEDVQTSNGLPLCSDYAVAKLNEWVKNNTTLSLENEEYHIEGHYETIRCDN